MKKVFIILLAVVISGTLFEGCLKKGEGDPFISLRSRKGRLEGEWKLKSGTVTTTSVLSGITTVTTETYDGTTHNSSTSVNGGPPTTSSEGYADVLKITKDGTFEQTVTQTSGTSTTITFSQGNWNFNGGVGEVKNKEEVIFYTTSVSSGGNTTSYSGDYVHKTYQIHTLKNKELVLKATNKSSDSNSSSETIEEWTYIQD
jgi:hypothetical protein